jgi:phospho-N-acetylmuramoyl-pentapeptide-transferase
VTSILIAGAGGLVVTLLGTPFAIRAFRAWGWGQLIREDGPQGHMEKMGTPTMGGVVIIAGVLAGYVLARISLGPKTAGLCVLAVGVGLGGVGAVDDLLKIRRQRSLGLNKTAKFVGQAAVGIAFAVAVIHFNHVVTHLPGTTKAAVWLQPDLSFIRDTGLRLGLFFYLWGFIMIAAASNGVNLTDGLDGLASGSSALVFAAYVIIAFWEARHSCLLANASPHSCYPIPPAAALDVAIVAAAALGAVAGFLWWNAAPAKIFMGDTGSLALGGLLAALAIVTDTQLLLLVLGGLFALVTLSVIVQVVAFRLFQRRVFRMAPLHHHFELAGWPEFTVIVRFWILAGLAVAFGLGLFYADFLARGGTT